MRRSPRSTGVARTGESNVEHRRLASISHRHADRWPSDPRLVPSLREAARTHAPLAPLESITTMDDRWPSLAQPRLYAVLLGTFAVFALAIAGVGLFGVLSYAWRSGRARSASAPRSARRCATSSASSSASRWRSRAAGLAVGLIASYWLTTALRKFLYGVTTHDVVSFAAVAVALLLVAVAASIVPARRAARVDPVKVLRS